MSNILIVDDEYLTRNIVKDILEKEGYSTFSASNYKEALNIIENENIDLVYLDVKMPEVDGLETLKMIKGKDELLPIVMLTADTNIDTAINAIKLGAEDYITKDSIKNRLLIVARNILKTHSLSKEINNLKDYLKDSISREKIIYESKIMQDTINLAEKAASSNIAVLIIGESGTGKELLARFIHSKSKRSNKSLIAIDCAMLPENLVESELFGYEKGAFTGAVNRKLGRIELAHEGTLFLDEVGNLTSDVQKKILRFLEEKTIEHLGGKETIRISVRLIAASNINLEEAVKNKIFREDLFYRLNVFTINLPSLRERMDDIPLLADYFVKEFSKEHYKINLKVSPKVVRILNNHNWPGNVRELKNVMQRAVLLAENQILPEHLPKSLVLKTNLDITQEKESGLLEIGKKASAEAEKEYIVRVLKETNGSKVKAAKRLKIDYKTLFNKIKEYGISTFMFLIMLLNFVKGIEKGDFSLVEGFPLEVEGQFVYSSPLFFDINKDGENEIIFASSNKLYVLDKKGHNLKGWPVNIYERCESTPAVSDIDKDGLPEVVLITKAGPDISQVYIFDGGGHFKFNSPWRTKGMVDLGSSPVLADLDGDGFLEIIFSVASIPVNGANVGIVYVYKMDGSILSGWPQIVLPEGKNSQWLSTPVIEDINKDNILEIIVASIVGKIFVWQPKGFLLENWPRSGVTDDVFYTKPGVFDIDKDGKSEILIGSCNNAQAGNLYAWKYNGESLAGFPVNLKSNIQSVCATGDLAGNGNIGIVIGTNLGNKVWALNNTGEILHGWPVETKGWMCNNPSLADVDGDGKLEIFIGCREPLLYGFYFNGKIMPGFPLELTKEPYIINRTPAITIDKEGNNYICYNADKKIFLWKRGKK
ncbi:MAG: sigma 54-interacting transcriptional regulator [Candidatus Firestonebacteria bacterium]